MDKTSPGTPVCISRLIAYPALMTLAVTLLRLIGELQHWSKSFFNPEAGGPGSIVGITWLAPIFGIYFALKLRAGGEAPPSAWRALGFAFLGVAVMFGSAFLSSVLKINQDFYLRLIYFCLAFAVAAVVTLPGWPALFRTMLAYGLTARVPVALIMFLAFRRSWGTHYDAAPPDLPAGIGLWPKYLWLGFFPQLIFWVGFTIVAGMLFGTVAAAMVRRAPPPSQTPS